MANRIVPEITFWRDEDMVAMVKLLGPALLASLVSIAAGGALVGCGGDDGGKSGKQGDSGTPSDLGEGGSDSRVPDAGDGGNGQDGGDGADGGVEPDGGDPDGGKLDGGVPDGGGEPDGGGVPDGGEPADAGPDGGAADISPPVDAAADAATDTGPAADLTIDAGPTPAYIRIEPADGAGAVPLDSPVIATVVNDEDAEEYCEFFRADTSFFVEGPDGPVPGRLYYYNSLSFPGAKRIDFRADSFLQPETSYTATVATACAPAATATFTTATGSGDSLLAHGDSFRIHIGEVRHPASLGPLIGSIIDQNQVLVQVTDLDGASGQGTLELFGGEGKLWLDGPTLVYSDHVDDFVLFLAGELVWPHFRAVGSMSFEVARGSYMTIEHFELGGTFVEEPDGIGISDGSLIGIVGCEALCDAVREAAGGVVSCDGIRPAVCDDQDDLNLMGSFSAEANDLLSIQTITVLPEDGAQQVAPDVVVTISLTQAIDPTDPDDVFIQLVNDAGEVVPGAKALTPDGLGATFTPAEPLAPGAYTLGVVSLAAVRTHFTVGE